MKLFTISVVIEPPTLPRACSKCYAIFCSLFFFLCSNVCYKVTKFLKLLTLINYQILVSNNNNLLNFENFLTIEINNY